MSVAGYSGTPLLKKLGIKENMKILLMNAPDLYTNWLETDIKKQLATKKDTPDFVHVFAKNYSEFQRAMVRLERVIKKNTSITIWISWYKKSAGIATDLTEDIIRRYALSHHLVDIKVCAVSTEWSGLKLVVPLSER
jgi:hypothetical protein